VARIRSIKPEFFDDFELSTISAYARLAFIGLWCFADRAGRLKDDPMRLRARLFPFEPQIDMDGLLGELASVGVLVRYAHEGTRYLSIPGFERHQRPHPKEPDSMIPAPKPETATVSRGDSRPAGQDVESFPVRSVGGGREGDLGSGKGAGTDPPPLPRPLPAAHPEVSAEPIVKAIPPWAVWRGERLYVPSTWHERHIGMLGGPDAERRLIAWYQDEDAHLVKTQTPVRDWFKWLDARYAAWVPEPEPAASGLQARTNYHLEKVRRMERGE
jgi:hypothetical protein